MEGCGGGGVARDGTASTGLQWMDGWKWAEHSTLVKSVFVNTQHKEPRYIKLLLLFYPPRKESTLTWAWDKDTQYEIETTFFRTVADWKWGNISLCVLVWVCAFGESFSWCIASRPERNERKSSSRRHLSRWRWCGGISSGDLWRLEAEDVDDNSEWGAGVGV